MRDRPSGSLTYGGQVIDYDVCHADRETLEIAVHPNGSVVVTAPTEASSEEIEGKVRKRLRWIVRQQRQFREFEPRMTPRHYVPGETHLYLGRQYRLKVELSIQAGVKLSAGLMLVSSHKPSSVETTRDLVEGWYRSRAKQKFPERIEHCLPPLLGVGIAAPPIEVRRMTKRWGSLTSAGRMIINHHLIKAPVPCIDYVITHELCHMVHQDHSRAFYDLLDRVMPDWEKRKQRLERALA